MVRKYTKQWTQIWHIFIINRCHLQLQDVSIGTPNKIINFRVSKYWDSQKFHYFFPSQYLRLLRRAPVKRTYGVYYALRLPPDVQIELQRRTADFRNFFCPSEIDTRDVQKLSKGPPTFNQLYDVCPAYLPEIRYLCWLSFKDVPLSACGSFIDSHVKRRGTLLMAAWSLRVFVTRAELINWCFYN